MTTREPGVRAVQNVSVDYSAPRAPAEPGLQSCTDQNGGAAVSGQLDTSPGTHSVVLVATSKGGQSRRSAVNYTAATAPTIS